MLFLNPDTERCNSFDYSFGFKYSHMFEFKEEIKYINTLQLTQRFYWDAWIAELHTLWIGIDDFDKAIYIFLASVNIDDREDHEPYNWYDINS